MKAKYYVGGLTLGVLSGVAIGYWIARDARRRNRIEAIIETAEDKVMEIADTIKAKCGCGCADEFDSEEDTLEGVLIVEPISEADSKD